MKFLVWGKDGWLGGQFITELKKQGHEVVGAESRADIVEAVGAELDAVKPDRVFCCIGRVRGPGYSTIDYLEQKGKLVENLRDNMWAPLVIAEQCKRRGIHTVYMGTGCIFNYDEAHECGSGNGFCESDLPNFFGSSYSTAKGFSDGIMHMMFDDTVLNCRIRMPITADNDARNFIVKIANYERVVNIPNSMTVLPELIPIMVRLSVEKVTGALNLTNPGAISHNEVLELYKKHVDPDYTYENFTLEEQATILLSDRSNNLLDCTRLKELAPEVDDIYTAVEKVCIQMARDYPKGVVARRM